MPRAGLHDFHPHTEPLLRTALTWTLAAGTPPLKIGALSSHQISAPNPVLVVLLVFLFGLASLPSSCFRLASSRHVHLSRRGIPVR